MTLFQEECFEGVLGFEKDDMRDGIYICKRNKLPH